MIDLLGIPIGEMFDTPVGDIEWNNTNDEKRGIFSIDGTHYVCNIELRNISQLNISFANVSFGVLTDGGDIDQHLQNWKSNPFAVLAGVKKCLVEELTPMLKQLDAVVFVASITNGEVDKRMRLYASFVSYFDKSFRFKGDHQFKDGSKIHIMHSINDSTQRTALMKFVEDIAK